jgi:hypothetical protein
MKSAIHTYLESSIHTYIHELINTCVVSTSMYVHTHVHTYVHTYTYTHMSRDDFQVSGFFPGKDSECFPKTKSGIWKSENFDTTGAIVDSPFTGNPSFSGLVPGFSRLWCPVFLCLLSVAGLHSEFGAKNHFNAFRIGGQTAFFGFVFLWVLHFDLGGCFC